MRRIVIVHAQPGMVLRTPINGPDGEMLFASGHVLNEADIAMLHEADAAEIEVQDALAAYEHERPLFAAPVEAAALQALNTLIMFQSGLDAPVSFEAVQKLFRALDELVDGLYPDVEGQVDFSGPDSLQGHDYIHPIKVAEVATCIGRLLGLPKSRLVELSKACALMNIGYSALRRSLLDEPRGLEEHEWRHHVEMHPEYGVKMLAAAALSNDVVTAIAQHHERWDGSGYPRKIKANEIAEFARVIAVADTYVSLRSRRAYRNALSHKEAMKLLEEGSNEFFDPAVVGACRDVMKKLVPAASRRPSLGTSRAVATAEHSATSAIEPPARTAAPDAVPAADIKRGPRDEPGPPVGHLASPPAAVRVLVPASRVGSARVGVVRAAPVDIAAPVPAVARRSTRRGGRPRRTLWAAGYYLGTVRGAAWDPSRIER